MKRHGTAVKDIYLYGAPASGKTTLGGRLAKALGKKFVDLDALIVEREGREIPQIFKEDGEAAFRRAERAALESVAAAEAGAVVALGGGTLLDASSRETCEKSGSVFCMETPSQDEIARRMGAAPGTRPLGDKSAERAKHYASFKSRVETSFEAGESLVVVGTGIARGLMDERRVVADENVARLFDLPSPIAIVPSGERHKTLETVSGLWAAFARAGIGRGDTVTAVGGGVTLDLAGFAAATWMRGVAWVDFPTTLLSMVDASTGGKTGFDLPEGKNLVGAFHPPRLVVVDTDFLRTLTAAAIAEGRAEMVKHEVIGALARTPGGAALPTAREIAQSLSVKAEIVTSDPFERTGRRILLNCGHTVAHAVERLTGYSVSHGMAVAIGCVEEARLAVRMGLAPETWPEELASRFREFGLETELPAGLSFEKMADSMRGDKKRSGDVVTFALPCGWGDVRKVPIDLSRKGER